MKILKDEDNLLGMLLVLGPWRSFKQARPSLRTCEA